ncbi:hypothetical protein [Ornithinimicrobium kibberense]|uniref:hypothetical protein n=1 Tax=Ornithinimicrobium kibberense TaxID=282060 RepID=UPI00360A9890
MRTDCCSPSVRSPPGPVAAATHAPGCTGPASAGSTTTTRLPSPSRWPAPA